MTMTATTDTTAPVAPALLVAEEWIDNPQVTLSTSLGNVVFELFPNAAPVTVANWLAYVGTDFFSGLLFHRVIPGFVAQGGGFSSGLSYETPTYPAIRLESNNGLSNLRGTLAMARTSVPSSANSQFYVNLADNTFLDYANPISPGYAVFGEVVAGMATIDAIAGVATATQLGMANVPVVEVSILGAEQTQTGVTYSATGNIYVWGIESGAQWEYSRDGGLHWTAGTGSVFALPEGAFEAAAIQVRQRDLAGNVSAASGPGADLVVDARTAAIGNALANRLTGTAGDDPMYGLGGPDVLDGLGGRDSLDGGSGSDTLVGGAGGDTYWVRDSGDLITEAAGAAGTDTVNSLLNAYSLAANLENGRILSAGTASLTGNGASNILYAGLGNNVLKGGSGLEVDTVSYAEATSATAGLTLSLAIGAAQATGGSGSDTLSRIENLIGSAYADTLGGSPGDNALGGGAGNDNLLGGGGNDTLDGGSGNDTLVGGAGDDRIEGAAGTDTLSCAGIAASIVVDLAGGTASGTSIGSDTLSSIECVIGGNQADRIGGSSGANRLEGGGGADTLEGGAGNDTIVGGAGNDSHTGGDGADVFRFATPTEGADRLADFASGADKIQVVSTNFALPTGTLAASRLVAAGTPLAGTAGVFVYDSGTGVLAFDSNGSAAGGLSRIATLTASTALLARDIQVVAA
jgi:cyclophilin family peptidyl-prolyl cis-trans isomerase